MDEHELVMLAQDLICRVRDDEPEANGRWLLAATTEADRFALLFVLAAAVPTNVPWSQLVAWARYSGPDTPAAIAMRQQDLLDACDYRIGRRRAS